MRQPLVISVCLHLLVALILTFSAKVFIRPPVKPPYTPLIVVDLSKIEIKTSTNLPALEQEEKLVLKEVFEPVKAKPTPPAPPVLEVKEKESDNAKIELPPPPKIEEKKEEPKPKPKKETPKAEPSGLSSLLASVAKIEKSLSQNIASDPEKIVTKGVKGGVSGDLSRPLSISEKDAIANQIKACWNIEAGAKGIKDMVVNVKVKISQDGKVQDVTITDKSRYNDDPFFRSVAESARRAVYVCDKKGDASPFAMMASKHQDKFDQWHNLNLNFSPVDGSVR